MFNESSTNSSEVLPPIECYNSVGIQLQGTHTTESAVDGTETKSDKSRETGKGVHGISSTAENNQKSNSHPDSSSEQTPDVHAMLEAMLQSTLKKNAGNVNPPVKIPIVKKSEKVKSLAKDKNDVSMINVKTDFNPNLSNFEINTYQEVPRRRLSRTDSLQEFSKPRSESHSESRSPLKHSPITRSESFSVNVSKVPYRNRSLSNDRKSSFSTESPEAEFKPPMLSEFKTTSKTEIKTTPLPEIKTVAPVEVKGSAPTFRVSSFSDRPMPWIVKRHTGFSNPPSNSPVKLGHKSVSLQNLSMEESALEKTLSNPSMNEDIKPYHKSSSHLNSK